ncbi:hypothetical protein FOQG_16224 [Fusarium oxysporum f. sp. raphani 54005]|uniref:Uncharacterized protein n=1 Tax=Fusarium oxysporum f. sp. raphani 54005 TaxID=1089458 RepID=X0BL02_FUSOX|nr:hypothetical protein FOQG_16224 [Fusarium oxysporum f. sp. raphani 54005]
MRGVWGAASLLYNMNPRWSMQLLTRLILCYQENILIYTRGIPGFMR